MIFIVPIRKWDFPFPNDCRMLRGEAAGHQREDALVKTTQRFFSCSPAPLQKAAYLLQIAELHNCCHCCLRCIIKAITDNHLKLFVICQLLCCYL